MCQDGLHKNLPPAKVARSDDTLTELVREDDGWGDTAVLDMILAACSPNPFDGPVPCVKHLGINTEHVHRVNNTSFYHTIVRFDKKSSGRSNFIRSLLMWRCYRDDPYIIMIII
jgi:hypothetical protein